MIDRNRTQHVLDRRAAAAAKHAPRSSYTIADRLIERAAQFPDRPLIYYGDKAFTYSEVDAITNRLARFFLKQGLRLGDVVSICIENRPEFYFIWWGLAKIGVTVSLLNTNLSGNSLKHCVKQSNPVMIVAGIECFTAIDQISDRPICCVGSIEELPVSARGDTSAASNLILEAMKECDSPLEANFRYGLVAESVALHIFTSGTTGYPKAAKTSHMRWLSAGETIVVSCEGMDLVADHSDVFYCFLPLYHGAAVMSLTSTALQAGASIVLRRKFSAREFWPDVRRYRVTICQYIGEVCRYLLNQPPLNNDRDHSLRIMIGAGLNSDIWRRFVDRFGIDRIFEGWGGTELNATLFNVDNVVGSCGRVPYWDKTNIRLVKYDVENGCYVRNESGCLRLCNPGEVGELIAMVINQPDVGAGRFEGYTSITDTERKILRNIFVDGDSYVSSGDLARYDEEGYFYFVDRIGDTFRWKSENVSTTEVAEAFSSITGIESITIYGVNVPNTEGRAGMASVVMSPGVEFDPVHFYSTGKKRLPDYAMPLFVRLSKCVDMTSTFKLKRIDLQREGYHPDQVKDPVFVISDFDETYVEYSDIALSRALKTDQIRAGRLSDQV
ncbi:long-chain-acyl-CoA synthetase [Denitratisoma oestradiolicum]|uniref:Long-chain acyl-CoA synthetase n=1 Tax=Denitratisoma oestradiolicum TaxID=311182 RepID=A0A6S6YKT5_9PROT|nr:long-chain-acyl-CoA synthetase [Denitratisoma oestradiolicum]TWO78839.1 long-chain-acyl-CoA synthetase [Denitratisoma oestradiolicum]CAB1368344.1 Long-chain acyl-CoA synthetase [Denitratisoma oestradiolicum]